MGKTGRKIINVVGKVLIGGGLIWAIGLAGGDDYNTISGINAFPKAAFKEAVGMIVAGSGLIFGSKFNFKKAIKELKK